MHTIFSRVAMEAEEVVKWESISLPTRLTKAMFQNIILGEDTVSKIRYMYFILMPKVGHIYTRSDVLVSRYIIK